MKKITSLLFLAVLMVSTMFFTSCDSGGGEDDIVYDIGVTIVFPEEMTTPLVDSLVIGLDYNFQVTLKGATTNYQSVDVFFGSEDNLLKSYTYNELKEIAETQAEDATLFIDVTISASEYQVGEIDLIVQAEAIDQTTTVEETRTTYIREQSGEDPILGIDLISPEEANPQYNIGDRIYFAVEITGSATIFKQFDAYIEGQTEAFESRTTYEQTIYFEYDTTDLPVGSYTFTFTVTDLNDEVDLVTFTATLVEYIPTFISYGQPGYELKSIEQTYDNGYVTVSSDPARGTWVAKYDLEGVQEWTTNWGPEIGIGESIVEDTEYDKGYVIAGWRVSTEGDRDTWVRKIDHETGGLVWNKHYGFKWNMSGSAYIDDGATVIRKSKDDGYIIGGYTYDYYGTENDTIYWGVSEDDSLRVHQRASKNTGYDIRLLKLYSNGNEVWGHEVTYCSHKFWRDLTGHGWWEVGIRVDRWIEKMGDQYITDLIVMDNGEYLVTGWNNNRFYLEGYVDNDKKDVFYAQFDLVGGYKNSLTWSRMGIWDLDHPARDLDFADHWARGPAGANSLGAASEDEIGYGITMSNGGYGGDVVMAGEAYEIDDLPNKSKLHDGWFMEFLINGDDDGALWEYTYQDPEIDEKLYGIQGTKDTGYITTGYKDDTGSDKNTIILKLDNLLQVQWAQDAYSVAGDDFGVKALQCRDGGFIVGGNEGTGASIRAKLIKVNKLGIVE